MSVARVSSILPVRQRIQHDLARQIKHMHDEREQTASARRRRTYRGTEKLNAPRATIRTTGHGARGRSLVSMAKRSLMFVVLALLCAACSGRTYDSSSGGAGSSGNSGAPGVSVAGAVAAAGAHGPTTTTGEVSGGSASGGDSSSLAAGRANGGAASSSSSGGASGSADQGELSLGSSGRGAAASFSDGPQHVSRAVAFPSSNMALVGLRIAVDPHDTAVVLGPAANSDADDPGAAVTWLPATGATRQKVFAGEPTPHALAVDASSAVWLAGGLEKAATFGGATVPATSNGYGLVKLAPDGSNLFTKAILRPEADIVYDSPYAITFDAAGNAYVVGSLVLSKPEIHVSVLINKFSPTGELLADRVFFGDAQFGVAEDAAIAPSGDLVIAGSFGGTLVVGEQTLVSASGEYNNGFVAIVSALDLSPKHAYSFGGAAYYDRAFAVDVTSTGRVRVAGVLAGRSSIGGSTVEAETGGSGFIAQLSAAGAADWVKLVDGQSFIIQTSTNAHDRTFAAGSTSVSPNGFLGVIGDDAQLTFPLQMGGGLNGAVATASDLHGGVWVALEGSGDASFGNVPLEGASGPGAANLLVHLEP
jgi:hypothetical protein